MRQRARTWVIVGAAAGLIGAALPPASAVVPLLAGLGKQILQNLIFGEVKGQLIGSLSDMGCKGAAIARLIATTDLARAGAGMPPALAPAALSAPTPSAAGSATQTDAGGAWLGSLRGSLRSMTGAAAAHAGASPGAGISAADPTAAEAEAISGVPVRNLGGGAYVGEATPDMTTAYGSVVQREMAAAARQAPFGALSGADAIADPQQAAQIAASLGQIQQAMAQPLSRHETLDVFDDLTKMGVLTTEVRNQVRECVVLAPPSAGQALGQVGALFKRMLIPQLQAMRVDLERLPPEQQQQLAAEIAGALREADPRDRKAFRDGLGAGFFPPGVLQQVRASGALD